MKYLLDTHVAIWALDDKSKLSASARKIIDDTSIPLCVSIVSAWEIAIKVNLGKLNFRGGSALFIEKMQKNGIEVMDINSEHIIGVEKLTFIHKDPFDHLLIATTIAENLIILTADENIHKYNISCIW